jgi:N-acetylglucosaminyldiphosphoundecaprenol N-acetyl-beta-D-mannosaminyltransferase
MNTKILNYDIFNKSQKELIEFITNAKKINIVSGNPEVLYNGLNNKELLENFKRNTSVIIPDGVGVVLASKLVGQSVKQKIAGIDVLKILLKKCETENKTVYLLGAKMDILNECIEKIIQMYPGLNIIGSHDGYFDINNCDDLLSDITDKKPYVLFVAMGCPRQEKFIAKYMDSLPCNIFMGVGGSFDVISGRVKRAPKWMIKMGLEWLYRVSKEPYRIKRLTVIPKFLLMVFDDKYNKKRDSYN